MKVNVVATWLQQTVLLFLKHREHFIGFKVLLFIFFTVLLSIMLLQMNSLRFSLHLEAEPLCYNNFRIILLMSGKNQLYAIAKLMRVLIDLSF